MEKEEQHFYAKVVKLVQNIPFHNSTLPLKMHSSNDCSFKFSKLLIHNRKRMDTQLVLQSSNWVLLQVFGAQHRFSTSCPKSHQFPTNLLSTSKENKKKIINKLNIYMDKHVLKELPMTLLF
jgi:hypothetical protein